MTIVDAPAECPTDLAARFAVEVAPHVEVLSRGARRLTRNAADAEDLLQDTLLHAYRGFGTFAAGSNARAWLFRILHNRWVSAYRAQQRRPAEVPVDEFTEHRFAASAEAEVLDALFDDEITAAMDALPEGFRSALYYTDLQGYTCVETAAILDVPVGTVMSRLSRGRQRLRTALAHLDVAEERIA